MNITQVPRGRWATVTKSNVVGIDHGMRFLRTADVKVPGEIIYGVFEDGDFYWEDDGEEDDGTYVEVELDVTTYGDIEPGQKFSVDDDIFIKVARIEHTGFNSELNTLLESWSADGFGLSTTENRLYNFSNDDEVTYEG